MSSNNDFKISEKYIIKFFDNELHAENLLNKGEMLFNTLSHFAELEQVGRGDKTERVFNSSGTLYFKMPEETRYQKLLDYDSIMRDIKRPVYCYTRLTKNNFLYSGAIGLDSEMLNQFGLSNNSLYCVVLEKRAFENKVIEFLSNYGIGYDIANIRYTNEEIDHEMVMKALSGQSNLAYFHKPLEFRGQQERRIMLAENIDDLIKRGIMEKFNDGGKIYIGELSSLGIICKVVKY